MPLRHAARRRGQILGSLAILLAVVSTAGVPPATSSGAASPAVTVVRGSLRGSVRVGPRLAERRIRFSLYPDVNRDATDQTQSTNELTNVVVYLESAPTLTSAPAARTATPKMEQARETFLPHVLPVVVGTTVEFANGDPIFHNVFSLSKASSFDLGRYPKGSSRMVRFDRPGVVKVFCHIHSDMSAVVLVLDNPFFTVPDSSGAFELVDIPAGRYVVTGWHERARPIRREVTIEGGRQTEIELAIPLEDPPDGR